MARTAAKLWENAFQTIPDVSFFDAEKFFSRKFFGKIFVFFDIFARFLRSYAKTDVASNFLVNFCSRLTYSELDTTLGAHLGVGYRPGTASIEPYDCGPFVLEFGVLHRVKIQTQRK